MKRRKLTAIITALVLAAFTAVSAWSGNFVSAYPGPADDEYLEEDGYPEEDGYLEEDSYLDDNECLEENRYDEERLRRLFPNGFKGHSLHELTDDFSMTKVLITIGDVTNIGLALHGVYYIAESDGGIIPIAAGANSVCSLNISAANGSVTVSKAGNTLYSGASVTINRMNLNSAAGYAQLTTVGSDNNNGKKYLGNFNFFIDDGKLKMMNIVPTAHYLYGIVPYEMSESWDEEALKAQAVTAKTYAFAFTSHKHGEDITDSMNYQGYRGYTEGNTKCMKACVESCGKLLSYNNKLLLTWYAASNGGETDLPSHAFGTSDTSLDDKYEIKLDDPDFEYATKKRQTLEITYDAPPTGSFADLLNKQVEARLGHSAQILSIVDCNLDTPKYAGSVRNLTRMNVTMDVLDRGASRTITVSFNTSLLKEKGIFTKNYKIYWGERTTAGYNVYFCRWGHGLGLSQYGAQARAERGDNYEEILSFYFRKFQLSTVIERNPEEPFSYTLPVAAYGKANKQTQLKYAASPASETAGSIPANAHLDIISESGGWILCIAGGKLGYIKGDCVGSILFPAPPNARTKFGSGEMKSSADMYASPSSSGARIASLNQKDAVTVKEEIGEWYYAECKGVCGFVQKNKVNVSAWNPVDLHKFYPYASGKDGQP